MPTALAFILGLCICPVLASAQDNKALVQSLERRAADAEKKGDLQELANSLATLSGQYAIQGRARQAIAAGQKALELKSKVDDVSFEFEAYSGLSVAYASLGDKAKAEEYGKRAQTLAQRSLAADAMSGKGFDFKTFEDLLAFAVSHNDIESEANARFNLGNGYFLKNDFARAISYWRPAVPLFHQLGQWMFEGTVDSSIGKALDATGDHDEAAKSWRAAVKVFSDRNYEMTLDALDNLALSYYSQRSMPQAAAVVEEALDYRRKAGMMAGAVNELTFLVSLLTDLNQVSEARTRAQQLVQICRMQIDSACLKTANHLTGRIPNAPQ